MGQKSIKKVKKLAKQKGVRSRGAVRDLVKNYQKMGSLEKAQFMLEVKRQLKPKEDVKEAKKPTKRTTRTNSRRDGGRDSKDTNTRKKTVRRSTKASKNAGRAKVEE